MGWCPCFAQEGRPVKTSQVKTSDGKKSPGDISHYIYIGVSYIPGGCLGCLNHQQFLCRKAGLFVSSRSVQPLLRVTKGTSPPSGVTEFVPDTSVTSGAKIHPLKINGWNMSSWRFGRSFSFQKGCFVGSSR